MLGFKRLMRLMMLRPLTGMVLLNNALVRSEVRRRKWLLPPFVRTSSPEPVRRNRLEVALWVFSLYFLPGFALRGIAGFLLSGKIKPRVSITPADDHIFGVLHKRSGFGLGLGLFSFLFLFRARLGWSQHHQHGSSFH